MAGCLALIRVRVPDRPGALGLVASRIGALKGDIVGVEVLDRSGGEALDEFAVVLPDAALIPAVTREIGAVDGAVTESVTIVEAFPEPRLDAVRWAIALTRATGPVEGAQILVVGATAAVRAIWCAVVDGTRTLAVTSGAPTTNVTGDAIHLAPIGDRSATLAVGRDQPLRPGEHLLIESLCELADAIWE